jgi:hypothetical protein
MIKNLIFLLFPLVAFAQPTVSDPNYVCLWHCGGMNSDSEFGKYVVSTGDQNSDGYDDILVSAFGENCVYLYYGGNPMDTIPDMVFTEPVENEYGTLPLELKDLNGDGYVDIVIGAAYSEIFYPGSSPKVYVYFGGAILDTEEDLILMPDDLSVFPATCFGQYMSEGDFNGDGYNDVVISATNYDLDIIHGKIFVFYGGPNLDDICDYSVTALPNSIHSLGQYISCSGDVNDDGYDDIFCRGYYTGAGGQTGRMLFLGSTNPDTVPDWIITGCATPGFWAGGSFILPDINGDEFDELIIGADGPYSNNAYIFLGSENMDTLWDSRLDGNGTHMYGVTYLGDVNADGWPDVATGDIYTGIVNIFFLCPEIGVEKDWDLMFQYQGFGWRNMRYAGDVNGDGVDDFMLGSCGEVLPVLRGEVFIYSDTSLSTVKPQVQLSIPKFELYQNYPNPFNSATALRFELLDVSPYELVIYNIIGNEVWRLGTRNSQLGTNEVVWNAEGLPSGVYFVRLTANSQQLTASGGQSSVIRRAVLMK